MSLQLFLATLYNVLKAVIYVKKNAKSILQTRFTVGYPLPDVSGFPPFSVDKR